MSTNILQQKCFLNNQHYYPLNYLTIFLTSTNTDVSRLKIMDKWRDKRGGCEAQFHPLLATRNWVYFLIS